MLPGAKFFAALRLQRLRASHIPVRVPNSEFAAIAHRIRPVDTTRRAASQRRRLALETTE